MTTSRSPEQIAQLVSRTPLLLMLDIDGTLCDIVPEPGDARVPGSTRAVLQRLARRKDVHVALVTGRSARDAQRMAQLDGVHIHANHGIEIVQPDGAIEIDAGWELAAPSLQSTATQLAALIAAYPGSSLEHKEYTLSVHYRDVDASRETDLVSAVGAIAATHGVRVEGGKCVLNLIPAVVANKGTAVTRLVADVFGGHVTGSILFAGDDVTDEHAFRALAPIARAVTVKVGEGVLATAARYSLPDPRAVHSMLAAIEEQLA